MPPPAAIVRFLFLFCLAASAQAAEFKIATWNLNWLTTRTAGLPPDVKLRTDADFDRLRAYALELDADAVALQEIDSSEAAHRVFPPDRYAIHLTRDRVTQRVGFAVRRGLRYEIHPDVASIALDPERRLRSGADITLTSGPIRLRLLAVHLKQGCQHQTLRNTASRTCLTLVEQGAAVGDWIRARVADDTPFAVLGDFNRDMDKRDAWIATLRLTAPLDRATEQRASPCWGASAFIDHIVAGGQARAWMRPDTLRVLIFRETGADWKQRLSDHCPVSVRFTLPD